MALAVARVRYEMREIALKAKPEDMLRVSPKGTVPVLVLPNGQVLEESRDIMLFALRQHDPEDWLSDFGPDQEFLVARNDGPFKTFLDQYKYPGRYQIPMESARERGLEILMDLESRFADSAFLAADQPRFVDVCLFPFIRQFAAVDPIWMEQTPLDRLRKWLAYFVESALFAHVMTKFPVWESGAPAVFNDGPVIHSPID